MIFDQYFTSHLLVTASILIITWFIHLWKKNYNLPPGPWGLPFLGYYPFFSDLPYLDFAKLAKRYGNVFSFRTVGGKLTIVLNGAKTIKEVLINRGDEFDGKPLENNVIWWISDGLGIAQEEGEPWKEQRRFFLQTIKNFGFGKAEAEELIMDEIRYLFDEFRKTNGESTDIKTHMSYAFSSVACQILFSKKFAKDDPIFLEILHKLHDMAKVFNGNKVLLLGSTFDLVMKYSPDINAVRRGKELIRQITEKIVEEHVQSYEYDQPKDYVEAFLKQRHELQKNGKLAESYFTMDRLLANSMNLFLEATESVSLGLNSLLCELSKHQETQRKVQEEIDSVIGRERMPSMTDRQKLPYLESVLSELFRVASPFLMTTHYSNFAETTINGYRIPRRSVIISNLWSINNDPTIYPNPEKFDPQRFLSADGKKIKAEGPYPFGLGKRSCVGQTLAKMEVFLGFASLLQAFTLLPGDQEETLRLIVRN